MKRIISLLVALSLFSAIIGEGKMMLANASENSGGMSEILLVVKNKVEIPTEYKNFTYQYSSGNENGYWNFNWASDDGGELRIRADSKGRINNYNLFESNHEYTATKGRAPQFTRKEAEGKTLEFLKKTIPEAYPSLDKQASFHISPYDGVYNFTYNRLENDILCENQWVNVSINYVTGKVEYMSTSWLYDVVFEKIDAPISENDAKGIWKDNVQMELKYLYKYDEQINAYLAYVPNKELKEIDAKTGTIIESKYEWLYNGDNSMPEDMTASGALSGGGSSSNKNNFSEEELNKLTQHEKLLTLTQADDRIRKIENLSIGDEYTLVSGNLYTENNISLLKDDKTSVNYVWHIIYSEPVTKGESPKTVYADVDAKTGELKSYRDNSEDWLNISEKAKINENMATIIAKKFLDAVSGMKMQNVLDYTISEKFLTNDKGKAVNVGWDIFYRRGHSGISVANDGLNVSVNRMTGKITHYSYNWQEKVDFESAENIINNEQALLAYIDNAKAKLEYHIITTYFYDIESKNTVSNTGEVSDFQSSVVKNQKSTVLVYRFESPSTEVSAKTGEYINEVETLNTSFEGYADINGHWAAREIELLGNIGVLPKRREFRAYNKISQEEFLTSLFLSKGRNFSYDYAVNEGVITKSEINRTGAITRYQAVEFIVRFLGYGKLAKDHSIYRVNFSDAESIPQKYLGSVAIGKSIGVITGANGNYNGSADLTNGEAAMMIYNTMLKASEY